MFYSFAQVIKVSHNCINIYTSLQGFLIIPLCADQLMIVILLALVEKSFEFEKGTIARSPLKRATKTIHRATNKDK